MLRVHNNSSHVSISSGIISWGQRWWWWCQRHDKLYQHEIKSNSHIIHVSSSCDKSLKSSHFVSNKVTWKILCNKTRKVVVFLQMELLCHPWWLGRILVHSFAFSSLLFSPLFVLFVLLSRSSLPLILSSSGREKKSTEVYWYISSICIRLRDTWLIVSFVSTWLTFQTVPVHLIQVCSKNDEVRRWCR